jgi:micrococcal nuclease
MRKKNTTMRNVNLISIVIFILVAIFYLVYEKYSLPDQDASDTLVPIVAVHDGDTVSVIINKRQEKVRLIGIDAPEIGQKPWGEKARKYLETLLGSSGWKVKLDFDVDKRDKHGRILAYLWTTNGEMVNLLMLKSGNALLFTLPPNVKYVNDLRTAQREAKDGGFGIWGEKGLKEKPGEYRREHPRI